MTQDEEYRATDLSMTFEAFDRMLAWNIERIEGRAYAEYEVTE